MRIKGLRSKILRVYGNVIEQQKFPIPNEVKSSRAIASKEEMRVPKRLRRVALHYVIRNKKRSPFAKRLVKLEKKFAKKKKKKKQVDDITVDNYQQV